MTAYRFWTLTCDQCGEISDAGMATTVHEALTFARSEGWARFNIGRKPTDRCGKCRGVMEQIGDSVVRKQPPVPMLIARGNVRED